METPASLIAADGGTGVKALRMLGGSWTDLPLPGRVVATLAAFGACMLTLWVAFIAVMTATMAVTSDARIAERLREGIVNESIAPTNYRTSPFGDYFHSYDVFSECAGLGINFENEDESLLYRVAATERMVDPETGDASQPCSLIVGALQGGEPIAYESYLRYWHGYLAYMRPMLTVLSLENMHRVSAMLFFGVLIYFAYRSAAWFGPWAWPVVLVPPFLVGDFFTVPIVTVHAVHLIWIVLSVIVAMALLDHRTKLHPLVLPTVVLAAGATTNFVSFLINPPLAPALIAFAVIASRLRSAEAVRVPAVLLEAGMFVGLWFTGYFGAWVEKWLFAAAVLGPDAVTAEISDASTIYTPEQLQAVLGQTLHPFRATWLILSQTAIASPRPWLLPFTILAWFATAAILARIALTSGLAKKDWIDFALLLSPLMVVAAWIEAARFHSVIHVGFTYRSFLLFAILPLLAALFLQRRASGAAQRTA